MLVFKNTTTYNKELYNKFVQFHNNKYNLKYHLYTLFMLFLIVFCMVLQFLNGYIHLGIIFIFIMLIFLFWRVFHPRFFIKKEANSAKVKKQLKNIYYFYDNYMKVRNITGVIKLNYYKLYKVFEDNDNFYLYVNKNYSYVISKNGFSVGNANEFYDFIKKKIWWKLKQFTY